MCPAWGGGAGCFECTEVWSRLSSKLLGCFQVDGYELLLQQDLHPVYLGQQGESAAESPFHFYSEGKAPGWFMEPLRRLHRKWLCKIHAPQGQQQGPRSGSHSAGTEAAARPLPAGTSGGAVCSSVKIKPQRHRKKGWRSDETLSFFFFQNENTSILPDYQSNYVHWKKKKKKLQRIWNNKQKSIVWKRGVGYNYIYGGETW